MASPIDHHLCNGIPVDHRLIQFLPNTEQQHSSTYGTHASILAALGDTIVRGDRTWPDQHEVNFAKWLAQPDATGGLVIALQQPARSQVYTADVERVKDDCASLAYLDKSLSFMDGPGGIRTTSVFDAFPFITQSLGQTSLPDDAASANNTFLAMIEAKRPDVIFACWRIYGQDLPFSGRGLGRANESWDVSLRNGHIVRVVNGFHPSYVANFRPNESCFRKLFALELCKAFCELNGIWREEPWMRDLRRVCRERVTLLMNEEAAQGYQAPPGSGRQLRSATVPNTISKYEEFTRSFDTGLNNIKQLFRHMLSDAYSTQTSSDFYHFMISTYDSSECVCDVLLAVSEAMTQFDTGVLTRDPLRVRLANHISTRTLQFVKDDIPDMVRWERGLHRDLWELRGPDTPGRQLKKNMDELVNRFINALSNSFIRQGSRYDYLPGPLHRTFKEFAFGLEDDLRREYEYSRLLQADTRSGLDSLTSSFQTMGISNYVPSLAPMYGQLSRPSAASPSNSTCYNCGQHGHYANSCRSPRRAAAAWPSSNVSKGACYTCGQTGHWSNACPQRR